MIVYHPLKPQTDLAAAFRIPYLYDQTGSYDVVWMISIALGVFAALINWPIKERPIARAAAAA